jgi:hypothetical protein
MIGFEILTWAVLGAAVAALQVLWADDDAHPWRYLIAASTAAVCGGLFTRFSSTNLWIVGGYSIASLLLAGFYALAAVALIATFTHRKFMRRT